MRGGGGGSPFKAPASEAPTVDKSGGELKTFLYGEELLFLI